MEHSAPATLLTHYNVVALVLNNSVMINAAQTPSVRYIPFKLLMLVLLLVPVLLMRVRVPPFLLSLWS